MTNVERSEEPAEEKSLLMYAGTKEGLFIIDSKGKSAVSWTGGSVKKILSVPNEEDKWVILTSEGIFLSNNINESQSWEKRTQGIPEKVIKLYEEGQKSFLHTVQEIKDIKINPANPNIFVCNTKDRVYLSRNQGLSWVDLGAIPYRSNGIKAVASAFMPELTVFFSHSIYGIHYIHPDIPGSKWTYMADGLEKLETTNNPDEVSDIAIILNEAGAPEIYVSQTFRHRIYKMDWEQKKFDLLWMDNTPFGTVDSLYPEENGLYFLREGTVAHLDFSSNNTRLHPEITEIIRAIPANNKPNCIVINSMPRIQLSELWLLDEPQDHSGNIAANKEGIFLPVHHAANSRSLQPYLDVIRRASLNMVVIDMKDEEGRLRFNPRNPAITAKGRVFSPLDIEPFMEEMKKLGVYVVARVVVFKDRELYARENFKYAVWDRNGIPWVGFGQERWVDPYSEEVWDYIANISVELHERGIDEIQYDYIRFPTDGDNLADARYRWRDSGMDMESAIHSFLLHVRSRVKAPISIDIYGANGWYRTGARTGQEVELLAPLVDVICPMYYPSHFEQYFLAQHPPELRPWRIYYIGTLRNDRIARGQVIVRPWTQAFRLNVSYDRQYYNHNYVRRQIEGVREAGLGGFTHWNMGGRYDDLFAP